MNLGKSEETPEFPVQTPQEEGPQEDTEAEFHPAG